VRVLVEQAQAHTRPNGQKIEDLFALIVILTFTCSFSKAGAGREQVGEFLVGAVGCNLAWGIIEAAFYLVG
jgi:hypothetical protein